MRIRRQEIHRFDRGWKRAEGLNGIDAEGNVALAQKTADFLKINPISGHEMAGSQRDELRLLIDLTLDIHGPNATEAWDVEKAHLHSLFGESHPGIDVGRIIILVNDDIVAFAQAKPAGHETQAQRGWPDKCNFVGLCLEQSRGRAARFAKAAFGKDFLLIVSCGPLDVFVHGGSDPSRQRTDAGVRQKDFLTCHGEFVLTQFLVRQDLVECHRYFNTSPTWPK